jgi:hypothetical protein
MPEWKEKGEPPKFDQDLADSYVGKTILVGITYFDHAGKEIRRDQFYGLIESASADGIMIALKGGRAGQSWNMPPYVDGILPAKPGEYRLRSTGEVVKDPDLLMTWSITEPARH